MKREELVEALVLERFGPAESVPLFDAVAVDAPRQTVGEKRRARQQEAIQHNQHPLAVALRITLPLLPDVPTRTCGECRHRTLVGGHARDFPKCWWSPDGKAHPRITNGPGTDVRNWWPACRDFELPP